MKHATAILALIMAFLLTACTSDGDQPAKTRSMYYWSTTFRMDSVKTKFLNNHQITRLYVRYFDVVKTIGGDNMPNATISFESPVPEGVEVVPVVFIVNNCLTGNCQDLAEKIFARVLQMNETHNIGQVKELQIDCDWTMKTQKEYFNMLRHLREMAHQRGITLSTTIRLHQLSQTPPPADRGVLMMYNTGDHTDFDCQKPILDTKTTLPYLKNLASYKLPLATAYPLYRWDILFRDKHFVGIVHYEGEYPTLPGDTIVRREPTFEEIMMARHAIGKRRQDANGEIILFDLNNANIQRFNHNSYEKIFVP